MRRRIIVVFLAVGFFAQTLKTSGGSTGPPPQNRPVCAKSQTKTVHSTASGFEFISALSCYHPLNRFHVASRGHSYTARDVELLARAIYAEARGESFLGQIAVGAVIVNRMRNPRFPSTISGVIFQPGALCTVRDGQINLKPDSRARKAAILALAGADPTGGALYFYNPEKATSRWIRTRLIERKIGNHLFAR